MDSNFSIDKWDVWKTYISTVFLLMSSGQVNNHTDNHSGGGENDLETPDDTPEKAHEFICRIIENGSDNRKSYRFSFKIF